MSKHACSIDDCNRPVLAKGMCQLHYGRVHRTGGLVVRKKARSGELVEWLHEVAFKHRNKEDCLIWPFGRDSDGYGIVTYEGRQSSAHKIVCKQMRGDPPTNTHQVRHLCGNGDGGCVNRHHLKWGTPKQNTRDKRVHGTLIAGKAIGISKLSRRDIRRAMRLRERGFSFTEIAGKFNVHSRTIRRACSSGS